jgi:hypothetical protein
MFSKLAQFILGVSLSIACVGQTQLLSIPKNVRLPTDSDRRAQLINSLNGFLDQASGPNKDNMFVQAAFLPETSALLDEMKGMSDPGADKRSAYRCYLTNVDWLDSSDYIVQISYLGINDSTPVLKASFKLIAYLQGDRYVFRSPLRRNTATWHRKSTGKFIFYYTYPINEGWLNNYRKLAEEFDKKLGAKEYVTELYCCNTAQEGLELLGVDYKLNYNGYSSLGLSSFEDDISLNILGTSNTDRTIFDLHDLWHDRLHHVIPVSTINKPIDEGCAYLYGGSWGLCWEEIFNQFKAYMGDNKDWLTAFTENKNFASSQQYHLYVSYVINALLAQKMEREKGFPAVVEFLSCGRYEAGNDNYFRALDKIIGINRSNFNASVEKLVEEKQ